MMLCFNPKRFKGAVGVRLYEGVVLTFKNWSWIPLNEIMHYKWFKYPSWATPVVEEYKFDQIQTFIKDRDNCSVIFVIWKFSWKPRIKQLKGSIDRNILCPDLRILSCCRQLQRQGDCTLLTMIFPAKCTQMAHLVLLREKGFIISYSLWIAQVVCEHSCLLSKRGRVAALQ